MYVSTIIVFFLSKLILFNSLCLCILTTYVYNWLQNLFTKWKSAISQTFGMTTDTKTLFTFARAFFNYLSSIHGRKAEICYHSYCTVFIFNAICVYFILRHSCYYFRRTKCKRFGMPIFFRNWQKVFSQQYCLFKIHV